MLKDDIQDNRLLLLGKLTSGLIHDLRNPLAVVKLNLEYLKMLEKKLPDEVNNSLDNTAKAALKIQELIENLSGFAKPVVDISSLNEIIYYAIDFVKGSARRFNIRIENGLSDSLPVLNLDRNKILQVLMNLLINLIETSDSGSSISLVNSLDEDENVILEIMSSGGSNKSKKRKLKMTNRKNEEIKNPFDLSVCHAILKEYDAGLTVETDKDHPIIFKIKFQPLLIQKKAELQTLIY